MDEDLTFNLEDMNISAESLDFINEQNSTEQLETPAQDNTEGNQDESSEDNINENTNSVDVENTEEEASNDTSQEDAPSSDNSSQQDSTLYALAQYLKEEGVLFVEDELKDVASLEDLKDLISKSNEKARYSNLNESQQRYQDALANGVPKSEFEEAEREIQTFSNIKDDDIINNANLRYEIMAIDLIDKGIEKEKALKLAKLSLSDETSVDDAREALNSILDKKKESFRELMTKNKTEKDLSIEDVKKTVFDKEKLLDNKLNDMTKSQLFDLITKQVDADEEGRPLNEMQKWQRDNPVESSIMLNYMYLMTNKGKDLNLIKKAGASSASKELEAKLRNMSFDKDGSLIIPEHMTSKSRPNTNTNDNNKNNLTINI